MSTPTPRPPPSAPQNPFPVAHIFENSLSEGSRSKSAPEAPVPTATPSSVALHSQQNESLDPLDTHLPSTVPPKDSIMAEPTPSLYIPRALVEEEEDEEMPSINMDSDSDSD